MAIMPMFPLGSVLFPGAVLPLHVFEQRYRALVADCIAGGDHEFGVVLIERGAEVGGGDVRTKVGTVARMLQVAELDDGHYALVTVGTRRIRVRSWLPDDPYPRADVEDWVDDEPDHPDLTGRIGTVWSRVRRINALANELGDSRADATADVSADALLASYHLSALAPVGPADQQRLLAAPGPLQRLAAIDEALDDVESLLNFRLLHPSQMPRTGEGDALDFGEP